MPDKTQFGTALSGLSASALMHTQYDVPHLAITFSERSLSEETRRAYRRIIAEFFRFGGDRSPTEITSDDVLRWRDDLRQKKRKASTITLKLAVIRSLFEYLRVSGIVTINPAATRLVPPPPTPEGSAGRALTEREVLYLLSGPDKSKPEGARDYALLLIMLRLSLRVSEACSLRASSIRWSHGRWTLRLKVKGSRERTLPLPSDVKRALDEYLQLDARRRRKLHTDGAEAYLFQPSVNYRTLEFAKGLSASMAWRIVRRWANYGGIGRLSPHDLRRTAITTALDQGLSYRQVQMMSGHRDPKTVMRYDHHRENLEQNAVNFLRYNVEEKATGP